MTEDLVGLAFLARLTAATWCLLSWRRTWEPWEWGAVGLLWLLGGVGFAASGRSGLALCGGVLAGLYLDTWRHERV